MKRRTGSLTSKEIAELLRTAKESGVRTLTYQGLEVTFELGQVAKIETGPAIVPPQKRPSVRPAVQRSDDGDDFEKRKKFREQGVGSSDAPAVMNTSPWSNPHKLWEEKMHLRQPDPSNFPMRRGLRLEPLARCRYQDMTGIAMPAANYQIHPKYKFVRANADGVNWKEEIALEIKCPGKTDHALALSGKIPEKYKFQLVHLLLVLGLERIDYFSFDGEDGVIVPFERNKLLEGKLLSEEMRFWDCVTTGTPPPRPRSSSSGNGKVTIFPVRQS